MEASVAALGVTKRWYETSQEELEQTKAALAISKVRFIVAMV